MCVCVCVCVPGSPQETQRRETGKKEKIFFFLLASFPIHVIEERE